MLMAAELALPEHVFVHGFLLGADGREDEQVARQRARPVRGDRPVRHRRAALLPDARRRVRRRRRGRDGRGSRARYETELANEYGNLASRTIAMIARYRDGARPGGRDRPRAGGRLRRPAPSEVAALLDRAEATQALELIWQRVRRLNRYVEERAPWQLAQGPGRAPASSTRRSRRSPRACARQRAAAPVHAGERPSGCSTRSARRTLGFDGAAFGAARSRRRGRARSSRCSRSAQDAA